ncbi:MAG TPA: NADH-quinone oxidoreductase subunit M, partial [Anaerolineales bacterium]|nr:NADH-quinone oxidoreductase subunit M [Anaerolineales bacterium]
EAPTAGSVILAGVLLKMGAYGFIRFNLSLFPHASVRLAPWIAGIAVIGIIYGAIVSFAQADMKKLVAYSSISHMGFVMLGLFAPNTHGLQGAILQMINHGLSTGALFLLVGVIYERLHTRLMSAYGGLWGIMPIYGAIALIVTLSSMALPGLNGFVGEFTILLGAFDSTILGSYWFAGIGAIGVILAAIYLLQMYQRVFLGPVTHEENRDLKDLKVREIITLVPLLVFIFWIGLYPRPFFHLMAPAVDKLVATLQTAAMAGVP